MSVLLIIGGHRCGTSLAARMISNLGVSLGRDLLGANESNPHGHYEDRCFVDIHDRILQYNGMSWMSTEGDPDALPVQIMLKIRSELHVRETSHAAWGFKDPRICNFLPMWDQFLPDATRVIVIRHPAGAANSMIRRHMMDYAKGRGNPKVHERFWQDPNLALRIWLFYNTKILAYYKSTQHNLHILNYELKDSWSQELRGIAAAVGLDTKPEFDMRNFVDEDLGNSALDLLVSDDALELEAESVWEQLRLIG